MEHLDVTPDTLPLVLKLQSLRQLQAKVALPDAMLLIPILRQLRSLEVWRERSSAYDRDNDDSELDRFVLALQQAIHLTELALTDSTLTAAHLALILPPMHQLQSLTVWSTAVRSLDFLSRPEMAHLSATLKDLRLDVCQLDPTDLVAHLRPLRVLETLMLNECTLHFGPGLRDGRCADAGRRRISIGHLASPARFPMDSCMLIIIVAQLQLQPASLIQYRMILHMNG